MERYRVVLARAGRLRSGGDGLGGQLGAAGPVHDTLLYAYGAAFAVSLATRSLALRREDWTAVAGMGVVTAASLHEAFELDLVARSVEIGVVVFTWSVSSCMILRMRTSERRRAALSTEICAAERIRRTLVRPDQTSPPAGCDGCVEQKLFEPVGGDFYSFLHRDERHFAAVVADAAGRGVQAALVKTAVISTAELAHDPARVLDEMKSDLADQLGGRPVSIACVYANLDAGTMRIGNAGHPAVIVHSAANGRTTQYGARQTALGTTADETYQNTEVPVVAGDRIAIYSDGLAKAESARGGPFGTTCIAAALLETAHLDCRGAARRIVARARGWCAADFDDDVTLVLIDIPEGTACAAAVAPAPPGRKTP